MSKKKRENIFSKKVKSLDEAFADWFGQGALKKESAVNTGTRAVELLPLEMARKDAAMKAAQRRLELVREEHRLAALRHLEELRARKKSDDRWQFATGAAEAEDETSTGGAASAFVKDEDWERKEKTMQDAIASLRKKRALLPPVPREKRTR